MDVVWLSSYPKSGNTWLRFFLCNYFFGKVASSKDVAAKIPDIHKVNSLPTAREGLLLCKTHFMWNQFHPYADHTVGFIYIIRHPKDVLFSSLNFCRMEGDIIPSAQVFAEQFIQSMGVPKWQQVGMGSWPEHANSWIRQARHPHLILRYEELLSDPAPSFRKVIQFLGKPIDESRLLSAINDSSFESMKTLETEEKSQGVHSVVFSGAQNSSEGLSFMNSGKSRRDLGSISKELDKLFDARFNEALKSFGYL